MFLEISQNSQENTCARDYFSRRPSTLLNLISKNTFFTEHLRTTAFEEPKAINFFRKKAQSYMFERVLNIPMQLYQFHALQIKTREDKPYQYQSVQRFFSKYAYVKRISDSLQLSQKQSNLKSHSLTKNFLRLNIFAIHFPLNSSFSSSISLF